MVTAMKKVQIGARVTEKDAEFINLLEINGARSPSDKIRALIQEARRQREYSRDYSGAYKMLQDQLTPISDSIRSAEFENGCQSILLARILEWMPEFYAFVLSSSTVDGEGSVEELQAFEKGAIDKVVRLFESLLHLELSNQATSYNSDEFFNHVKGLENLISIITKNNEKVG